MSAPPRPGPASAAKTPAERVLTLRPPQSLAEVVESVLAPAGALQRDVRVSAGALDVQDGHVIVGGEAFALRPGAARQLRALAGVAARSPSVDLRGALTARGERAVLVRLDGREVRAVLGGGYVALDDLDVFSRIDRAIGAMGWRDDLVVRLVATTDATTIVRLTLLRSRVEVRPGDDFERGVEIANGECGRAAFTLTPIVWRAGCFNFARSTAGPTLRIVHAGAALRRLERDLRKDIAHALDAARVLLDGWRTSPQYDAANAMTDAAKCRSLAVRIAEERRAQRIVEDPR